LAGGFGFASEVVLCVSPVVSLFSAASSRSVVARMDLDLYVLLVGEIDVASWSAGFSLAFMPLP